MKFRMRNFNAKVLLPGLPAHRFQEERVALVIVTNVSKDARKMAKLGEQ